MRKNKVISDLYFKGFREFIPSMILRGSHKIFKAILNCVLDKPHLENTGNAGICWLDNIVDHTRLIQL